MNKIQNISYDVIEYDSTYGNTRLEIKIKGSDINYIILNTIRRSILSYIPNYAFTEFNFKKNNTIFNNNYLKLRLSNIPVWGVENNLEIFTPKKKIIDDVINEEAINEEDNINDDIDLNPETNNKLNSSTLKQLTMFVDYKSTDNDIITVTTDHAKFYYEEKKIDSPYKIPIPLVKLQPKQTITFSVITTVGIEQQHSMYSVVSGCFYNEINDNDYNLIIESRGGINEKRIIHVGLINIIDKLKNVIKNIPDKIDDKKQKGEIILNNEDSTLGNLLSYGLQKHKDIKFAGFNIPHPLEQKVKIHYELNSNKIIDVLSDVVDYFVNLFENIYTKNSKIKL
jgi:DNA-directed RNA polymerase subunit L